MPRNEFTSIFLPSSPIPDPPDWRPFFYMIFQVMVILIFVSFIGFIIYEMAMDTIDKPIWEGGEAIVKQQLTPPTDEEIALQFRIISPLSNTRIRGGVVTIICDWQPDSFTQLRNSPTKLKPSYDPELLVDDQRVGWSERYDRSWYVQVELKSGLHKLRVGSFVVEFIVESNDGNRSEDILPGRVDKDLSLVDKRSDDDYKIKKALWQVVRTHEFVNDADKCDICHEIIADKDNSLTMMQRRTLRPVNNSSSCIGCHDKSKIHFSHGNKLEIWESCSKCHILHGTTVDKKGLLKK
ncbi:MAG: cytochrome c3 family protein [Planctomycetaceae bacterium]|jgi:hypothetical protein|nr:cytochrome c3 family protein [Planctomycetaceae bacterium]